MKIIFCKRCLWFLCISLTAMPSYCQLFTRKRDIFNCNGILPTRYYPGPKRGDNGFRIKIEGSPEAYIPSDEYLITIQSTRKVSFRGFALRSVDDDNQPAGRFSAVNRYTSQVKSNCPNVVTHVTSGKKARVQVRWRAPSSGCVRIVASVIQKGSIWFTGDDELTLRVCERNETSVEPETNACCACGSASYQMTFYGLWSPQTHPKDYPPYSTHWSNIIGASHSTNYVIWEYGSLASEGVQKVAEWGWVGNQESEIRSQGDEVKSVVKTKAQWPAYEPRNLLEPPSDDFEVDTRRHLLSLLGMLGPSPDWNVGISKESMCTEACGWVGNRIYNLIPWDAGTDNGVSYMSPNSPTTPHEAIKPLTTSDHPNSPFFNPDGGPIPPVAKIVIKRLNIMGEQCGESEPVEENDDVSVTTDINIGEQPVSCMYGEWGDWSECEVTCGWGIKIRQRKVKFGQHSLIPCDSTMEKEICKGSENCVNEESATVCLYSEWTSWSDCGLTCGSALRVRIRALKWPSELSTCHEPLKEMSNCNLPPCGCSYSKWSDWMPCPMTCGVGQTIRKRSVESEIGNCTEPLIENTQCMTSMFCEEVSLETPGCSFSPWTDWLSCPVPCGPGQTFRKRVLESSRTSSQCDGFQMQNSKCMTSLTCENSCSYGEWSDWMPCSETCGVGSTLRKRFLTGSADSGSCENLMMETTSCHNSPCNVQSRSDCNFLPWSAWMPCSVTCGKGETLRKRFLNRTASVENCQDFEMETNRCMVACDITPASNCMYTEWTPWMPCDSSCETFRKRLLKFSPPGRECDPVVMITRRCDTEECREGDSPCKTTNWSRWSECSATCRRGGHRLRTRQLLNQTGSITLSAACSIPPLSDRRRCRPRTRCSVSCVMSSWSEWSPCEATCKRGRTRGLQLRRRKIMSRLRPGRRSCGPRKQKRVCLCPQRSVPEA